MKMKKSEIIKQELGLTYKDKWFYKYYNRLQRYWRLWLFVPANLKSMSKEEKSLYIKRSQLWITKKREVYNDF